MKEDNLEKKVKEKGFWSEMGEMFGIALLAATISTSIQYTIESEVKRQIDELRPFDYVGEFSGAYDGTSNIEANCKLDDHVIAERNKYNCPLRFMSLYDCTFTVETPERL